MPCAGPHPRRTEAAELAAQQLVMQKNMLHTLQRISAQLSVHSTELAELRGCVSHARDDECMLVRKPKVGSVLLATSETSANMAETPCRSTSACERSLAALLVIAQNAAAAARALADTVGHHLTDLVARSRAAEMQVAITTGRRSMLTVALLLALLGGLRALPARCAAQAAAAAAQHGALRRSWWRAAVKFLAAPLLPQPKPQPLLRVLRAQSMRVWRATSVGSTCLARGTGELLTRRHSARLA